MGMWHIDCVIDKGGGAIYMNPMSSCYKSKPKTYCGYRELSLYNNR